MRGFKALIFSILQRLRDEEARIAALAYSPPAVQNIPTPPQYAVPIYNYQMP